jgi:hypothetical protein
MGRETAIKNFVPAKELASVGIKELLNAVYEVAL